MNFTKRFRPTAAFAAALPLLLAGGPPLRAQTPDPAADHGAAALRQSLVKLATTASLLQVTAHPDDEDGGLLTLLARGRGVRTGLVTLTRGEGGQNKIGPELFEELGITRTEELLASGRFYGIEQFFTRAVDYGFSKTLAEALEKWRFAEPDGGPVVGDVVRAIRLFRPEVLAARFTGTTDDGHAHHQASSVVARKAFEEAGDPSKFPDQIREGLLPWQPRKLYIGNLRRTKDWSVTEDVGAYDPLLGLSFAQLAWQGLSRQRTQGVGQVAPDAGRRPTFYKRIDGTPLARVLDASGRVEPPFPENSTSVREEGFFDGLDESLPGIVARLGERAARIPGLRDDLERLQSLAREALERFSAEHPERSAPALARGLALAAGLVGRINAAPLAPAVREPAAFLLRIKERQFCEALNRSLSLDFQSLVEPEKEPGSPFPGFRFAVETVRVAVPGESFPVSATLVNRSGAALKIVSAEIVAPTGWKSELVTPPPAAALAGNEAGRALFRVTVSPEAAATAPDWHRASLEDSVFSIDDPPSIGRPLPPFPLEARMTYEYEGVRNTVGAVVETRSIDTLRGEIKRELAVEPRLSVRVSHPLAVVPLSRVREEKIPVEVEVSNNAERPTEGAARLEIPAGWGVSGEVAFSLPREKAASKLAFTVTPDPEAREGSYRIAAEATAGGRSYGRTLEFLDHPDIGSFYDLRPASVKVVVVDLRLPKSLRLGYVTGEGDSVPEVLRQLGIEVHPLAAEDLEKGDLSRYDTIVTGPRAYDVREDLRRANARLLDYVKAGGRLVVQYNSNTRMMNAGSYFPYPAKFPAGNARITDETSPAEMLEPSHPIWNFPNKIGPKDFDGWVQERGLYFLGEWSPEFTALLSLRDPGEEPLKGGLLVARYGKGTYVFTGISWFRQLPEGVPGALRIFANLISPGPAAP
jgi:LmbE family N-acetylglucosaminyl deacetylase